MRLTIQLSSLFIAKVTLCCIKIDFLQAWAEFMVMTEEDQISFLDASNKSKSNRNNDGGTKESHLEKGKR